MGLNGLVSRNVSGYVKNFEVCGEWKEHELQEHAKAGRVPEESMMMNTLVRVAVEKMTVLDSFMYVAIKTRNYLTANDMQLGTRHQNASYNMARSRPEGLTNEAHDQISLKSTSKTHYSSTFNTKPPASLYFRHRPSLLCRRHITSFPRLKKTTALKDALEPTYARGA